MKGIHRRLGIPVNPSSWKTAPYPWWCPRERNEICHWLPEVNRSYFWCYLVWHNQICPENQVIYLCSGQLKKKKNLILLDLSWGAVKEKQIFFLSWTTHFYLYYRLLSSLSSALIQEHWMVHDKSTHLQLTPKGGKIGELYLFYFETRKGKLFMED